MSISFFVLFKGFPNLYYILSSTTITTLILLKINSWQDQNLNK